MFGFGKEIQLAQQVAQLEKELAESRALLAEKTAELEKRIEFDEENQLIKRTAKNLLDTGALILHTISTGKASGSQIIELSIMDLDGNIVFDSLIKPKNSRFKVSEYLEKNGICNESLNNSPEWCDAFDRINTVLQGKSVVMYDTGFQLRLLHQTCDKYTVTIPKFKHYCLMELYAAWYGWLSQYSLYRTHKLETAASFIYGGYWQSSHRTLPNCRVLLDILKFIAVHNMRPRFFAE